MKKTRIKILLRFLFASLLLSCGQKIKTNHDQMYSRHLQEHVSLTVYSSPLESKDAVSLLIVCDDLSNEQTTEDNFLKLYNEKKIGSSLIVCIHSQKINRKDKRSIEKYFSFLDKELLPFIKKKSNIRTFQKLSIAGIKENGELAIGFAWENADKVENAISICSFADTVNNVILNNIIKSRKRPDCSMMIIEDNKEKNDDSSYAVKILVSKKSLQNNIEYIKYNGNKNQEAWDHLLPDILTKTLQN